jgi:hypothetical protein
LFEKDLESLPIGVFLMTENDIAQDCRRYAQRARDKFIGINASLGKRHELISVGIPHNDQILYRFEFILFVLDQ